MDKRERNDIFRVLDEETLKNSKKDVRSRSFLFPKRILWTAGQVENSRRLLEKEEMQISLAAHEPCILKNEKGEKASILLDYGIEIHGGISLLAWLDSTKRGAKVRVRFGESAAEAMSELGGKTNATNDHARRDLVVEVGMMSMNPIGETGFRFVRIDLLEPEAVLVIKSICAVMVYKDVPYRGSFSCSDPLLNRIWDVGAYTVHLNMQEYIWDGIKRDRLVLGRRHASGGYDDQGGIRRGRCGGEKSGFYPEGNAASGLDEQYGQLFHVVCHHFARLVFLYGKERISGKTEGLLKRSR